MPERLRIPGATSRTLLGYLVGLGLLRVVARQGDPAATACWRDGALELHSELDVGDLETFLLERWEPAPVVSPWNGGSGFFGKRGSALQAIEACESPRVAALRSAIVAGRAALARAGLVAKPQSTAEKEALLRDLRASLPDAAIEWLDAAVVMLDSGAAFPPLLISGGNDGNYDVADNYAQSVALALAFGGTDQANAWSAQALRAALWREPGLLRKMSLAHFFHDDSPVNSPSGNSEALGNPWELCLAVEGTLLLVAGAGRRLAHGAKAGLVAPFTMEPTGAGYGSAVTGENGKAELWLPLWAQPAGLSEIESLFREARAQVGRRPARSGLDAARAAAELGVSRGISAFERFSILARAGKTHVGVPAGTIEVRERPAAHALQTLDPWLDRVISHGERDVPRSQREAIRRLQQTAFAVAERGTPSAVRRLIGELGQVETVLAVADRRPPGLEPISPPAGPWLGVLDLAIVEVRLAIGLASVCDRAGARGRLPGLRDYLHGTGLDERGRRRYGASTAGSVPALALAVDRLAAVHQRRHQDAARSERADLGFSNGQPVALADLSRLVRGEVDDPALGMLINGLVLLDYSDAAVAAPVADGAVVDPLFGLLALAFHDPRRIHGEGDLHALCEPRLGWVARLRSRRVRAVSADVLLRLRLAGMAPVATIADLQADPADGPRLAAALLAHPRRSDLWSVVARSTLYSIPERQETTK